MKKLIKGILGNKQTLKEKALVALENKERKFIKQYEVKEASWVNQKLEQVVPEKLQFTLNQAFRKAFEIVLDKGSPIIEKTYKKKEQEDNYKLNAYASQLKQDKKSLQAFSKQAKVSGAKNMLISSVEGIGLGILGIGIPDIPIFTGMILKSIYEIAISYGFSYDVEEEQIFILKIIEVALLNGENLKSENKVLDQWIIEGGLNISHITKEAQITQTAEALSESLLYMKFIQGIPIIGTIGGIADTIYLRRIIAYAQLKYKKRFLYTNSIVKYFR